MDKRPLPKPGDKLNLFFETLRAANRAVTVEDYGAPALNKLSRWFCKAGEDHPPLEAVFGYMDWPKNTEPYPEDVMNKIVTAPGYAQTIRKHGHGNRGSFLTAREELAKCEKMLGAYLSPPAGIRAGEEKYRLGPGQTVERGGTAELTKQGLRIMQAIKHRSNVPLWELMRPSHDDAVWNMRFNQEDKRKTDLIRKAISRLNERLTDCNVKMTIEVSGPDLLINYR